MNRLFFRILIYFLSLLLPLVMIGSFYYVQATNQLKQEFTQKIQMNLTSSVGTIDIYLRTAQETSTSFFYDQTLVMRPYDEYTPDERARIAETPRALARIANNISALIDKLFLYVDEQKVYTPAGLEGFDDYFSKVYRFSRYDKTYWIKKLKTGRSLEILEASDVHAFDAAPKSAVPFVFKNEMNGHKVVMVMSISADTILNTIANHSVIDSTRYVVTDLGGNVIISGSPEWSTADAMSQMRTYFGNGVSGNGQLNINGTSYIVNFVQSENYSWNYYSITPEAEFRKHTRFFITSMIAVCIALTVIGVIFSFVFAFNLYNPIKRIRDILVEGGESTDKNPVEASSHDELDFIGMRIHRLIRHNHEFRNELVTLSAGYQNQNLLNFMQGGKAPQHDELQKTLRETWGFHRPLFVCCRIRLVYGTAFFSEIQDVERMMIQNKMIKIIHEIAAFHVNVQTLEEEQQVYTCLINAESRDEMGRVRAAMDELVDTFHYDSRYCSIHVGIGGMHEDVSGIRQSYEEARRALEVAGTKTVSQVIEAGRLSRSSEGVETEEGRGQNRSIVPAIIRYIEANYQHDLYLENIAIEHGVSAKYMSRIFKENTGVNLTSYISWYRISKAKEMLIGTDWNTGDISERVGIYSRTTFIRLFKKYTGATPNQYRDENKSSSSAFGSIEGE
jgi:two-component system response regulator YesN